MTARDSFVDVSAKVMNASHRAVWRLSGGRWLREPYGMPAVELHTIGRKSGQRRTSILTTPLHDDTRVVLVASKGGDHRDPDWYRNLVAHPEVELTIDGATKPMRARTASTDEKAELWPQITSVYKGYADYQKRTDRDIPVVICEPRAS
jgi:deazaflavin-dependent oxidoreductase (nitroreductase family)